MPLATFNLIAFNLVDPLAIAVLLFIVGCLLLVAEVFFPSGGVIGFCSAAAYLAAIWFAFSGGGVTYGVSFALAEVIGAPIVLYFAFQYLPFTPFGQMLLGKPPTAEEVAPDDTRHELLGSVGVARSKMLPSGAVEINGEMIDAVSQGQAIEPGQYVKVVEVRGNRVVVRVAPTGERPHNSDPSDLLTRPLDELGIDDDPLA